MDSCSYWNPESCEGSPHCPPRCPRFLDKLGEPTLISPFTSRYYEDLVAMYLRYDSENRSMGLPPARRELIEAWLDALLDRGVHFVARQAGQLVGHGAYVRSATSEPKVLVFVDTAHYDRGIGSELCRHVIAHAAEAGHESLELDVGTTNERAIHVYRRMGFEIVERRDTTLRMRLPFDSTVVETVRLPPAKR